MADTPKKKGAKTSPIAPIKQMEHLAPKSEYSLTNSCDLVNKFRSIIFDKTEQINDKTVLTDATGTVRMTLPTYLVDARSNPATSQVLDILRILSYQKKCQLVTLNIKDYMQMRGLSDEKTARKQLFDALQALWDGEIEYINTTDKRKGRRSLQVRIIQSLQKSRGNVSVEFGNVFHALLTSEPGAFVFQYPLPLLATDNHKTPCAYYMGVRLAELYKKRNTITVPTLLKVCKALPTVEEVRKAGKRQYKQRIQTPFERDLNSIPCLKWEYVDKAGKSYIPKTFTDFLNATIKFEFIGYPVETEQGSCEKIG